MSIQVYMFIKILQKIPSTRLYGSTCLLKFEDFPPYMFIRVYTSIREHSRYSTSQEKTLKKYISKFKRQDLHLNFDVKKKVYSVKFRICLSKYPSSIENLYQGHQYCQN